MKFFTTSEVSATVGNKIRPVRNVIEAKIKSFLEDKSYGNGIADWGHIIICEDKEEIFPEIKKYSEKKKDLDLRLKIDYLSMVNASEKDIYRLICKSMLRGIDVAENQLKIQEFDFTTFRKDLNELFNKEGWL